MWRFSFTRGLVADLAGAAELVFVGGEGLGGKGSAGQWSFWVEMPIIGAQAKLAARR